MFLSKIKSIQYFIISISFFLIDQLSKFLITKKFSIHTNGAWETTDHLDRIVIIDPILIFKRIDNKGIAFGIDGDGTLSYIITPLTIMLTIAIIIYLYKNSKKKNAKIRCLALSLILGGALGNLFDRIFFGGVVDFIGLFENIFPYIFNFADTFITIGMIMLLFSDLFIKKKKNEKQTNKNF